MSKPLVAALALTFALAAPTLAFADLESNAVRSPESGEPTIHQIYEAASAGRLSDADSMIAKVLQAHPSSAKAHFVHAELLAKEGKLTAAKGEFNKARELAPDLPFAKPEAVAGLMRSLEPLAVKTPSVLPGAAREAAPASTAPSILPKGLVLLALIGAGAFLLRNLMRRNASAAQAWSGGAPVAPSYGGGFGSAQPTPPQPAPAGGGMGIGGALAAGAAMGLGAVAVEEVVRHFSHRDDRNDGLQRLHRDDGDDRRGQSPAFANNLGPDVDRDLGGNDFGISDSSSWDSGGSDSSGGDDW